MCALADVGPFLEPEEGAPHPFLKIYELTQVSFRPITRRNANRGFIFGRMCIYYQDGDAFRMFFLVILSVTKSIGPSN